MANLRVSLYIDGFNIYHRINDYQDKTGICYKWLNYKSLFQSIIKSKEIISDIYFFSAITQDFGIDAVERHNKFITALESIGINIVLGYFNKKRKKCHVDLCTFKGDRCFDSREEKQTDVNMAIYLLRDAYLNRYDKCFLMSGDNDFAPVLEEVKHLFNKIPILITPPYKKGIVDLQPIKRLKDACYDGKEHRYRVINLKFDLLKGHCLPQDIYSPGGNLIVSKPAKYDMF